MDEGSRACHRSGQVEAGRQRQLDTTRQVDGRVQDAPGHLRAGAEPYTPTLRIELPTELHQGPEPAEVDEPQSREVHDQLFGGAGSRRREGKPKGLLTVPVHLTLDNDLPFVAAGDPEGRRQDR